MSSNHRAQVDAAQGGPHRAGPRGQLLRANSVAEPVATAPEVSKSWASRLTRLPDLTYAGLALLAALVSLFSASRVTVPVDSDFGLAAELPATYWLGLLLLNAVFAGTLLRGRHSGPVNPWLMAFLTASLVVVLFGAAAFVTEYPRGEAAWRHIAIADALQRAGTIGPGVDASASWPGFFSLLALVSTTTGVSALQLALWAPVVNVGLWVLAVAAIVRTLTKDPRRLWLTLWVFCLGNWQDQDHLSPQAFAFFLHLVVIALLLGPLRADGPRLTFRTPAVPFAWWRSRTPSEPDPSRRVAALFICLLLILVISGSHELTSFMLVVAVLSLTLTGRVWARGLFLLTLVIVGLWLVYPAGAYVSGHSFFADIGLGEVATTGVAEPFEGSPGHVTVVRLQMVLAGALLVTAAVGAFVDRQHGRFDLRPVLLMGAPLVLLAFQPSGGEMLVRVSLFALPFTAYLAAGALRPGGRHPRVGPVLLICCLLAPLAVTGRYGNARFELFTDNEVVAANEVHRLAPVGAAIISGAYPTPWPNRDSVGHQHRTVADLCRADREPNACGTAVLAYAQGNPDGAVILLNRAAKASMVMQGVLTPGAFDELEQWLGHVDSIHLVYENPDARIYRIDPP